MTVYAWLWDHLPGSVPVRVILSVLAILVVIVVCFWWIFRMGGRTAAGG